MLKPEFALDDWCVETSALWSTLRPAEAFVADEPSELLDVLFDESFIDVEPPLLV